MLQTMSNRALTRFHLTNRVKMELGADMKDLVCLMGTSALSLGQ